MSEAELGETIMWMDGHIHIMDEPINPQGLLSAMRQCGIGGGIIMSLPPADFFHIGVKKTNAERLEHLVAWWANSPRIFPFYWIDPTEPDACEQVDRAMARGVVGFKIICDRFYPGDERAMPVYRHIAALGKPILFHSGILWDGKASSKFNRPAEFEALLEVAGLRFAMAHISWPWCDEMIAVYGKLADAKHCRGQSVELFIDTTPGTPPSYREEALTKLMNVGYNVREHVFFGSDCIAHDYDHQKVNGWIARDHDILARIGVSNEMIEDIYSHNLKRFVGCEPLSASVGSNK